MGERSLQCEIPDSIFATNSGLSLTDVLSVDIIELELHRNCPSFFRPSEVIRSTVAFCILFWFCGGECHFGLLDQKQHEFQ